MANSVLIESLSFSYRGNDKEALKNISGSIGEGSFTAVMGHSGAGKSTLCCAMNGLVPRFFRGNYNGRILIDGKNPAHCGIVELSRMAGLLFQDFEAQLFCSNAELELAFGPENQGLPKEIIRERIIRYLSFVGLNGMLKRDPATFSGGQKQRLAVGSVLALEPKILVMDEPVTDLDPMGKAEVLSVADRLREKKQTLIVADTEPDHVAGADCLWLLREGEIAAQGPPGKIFADTELLQSCGVMIPPLVSLFRSLGWPGSPLGFNEARSIISAQNPALSQHRASGTGEASPIIPKGNPVLAARGLSFRYQGSSFDSLRNIDLDIREGEFVAILGQNGSGKTTLAKHFNGLLKPTSGTMAVEGKSTAAHKKKELARLVGYVFQNPDHQIFASTVHDEVRFGLKMLGEDPQSAEENVARALAATGLEGYGERSPFLLTRGERQRVAVASVLAVKPKVIILDEPTTGLDYIHQKETMEMLKDLNKMGHTIIIITHTMWIAESYAKRTLVMKSGEIIADGPTRAVFGDEETLGRASLAPSELVRLSNWLKAKSLTADDLARELSP